MRAKLRSVKTEMMPPAHHPIPEQGRWLASVLTGHYRYYAVPDNSQALRAFRYAVIRHWLHSATAPQPDGHGMTWERMRRLRRSMATPPPHPAPLARRALRRQNPWQEPSALDAHAGICAGGRGNRSLPRSRVRGVDPRPATRSGSAATAVMDQAARWAYGRGTRWLE